MRNCDASVKELLALYYDGELTPEEKAIVDEHIRDCEDCREELEMFKMMHDEFHMDDMEAPDGFHQELTRRLELEKPVKKAGFYSRYNKQLGVAAMFAFVILLGVIGLTNANRWMESSDVAETANYESEDTMETGTSAKMEAKMEMAAEEAPAESELAEAYGVSQEKSDDRAAVMDDTEHADGVKEEAAIEEAVLDAADVEGVPDEGLDYAQAKDVDEEAESLADSTGTAEDSLTEETDITEAENKQVKAVESAEPTSGELTEADVAVTEHVPEREDGELQVSGNGNGGKDGMSTMTMVLLTIACAGLGIAVIFVVRRQYFNK